MRKEKDWTFWVKIVNSGIFAFFILAIFFTKKKVFQPTTDDYEQIAQLKKSSPKTDFKKPLRLQIIVLNSISIFFLLMSVQEFRLNEFMSPLGVDPEKIPPKCRSRQEFYYWTVLSACFVMITYNVIMHSRVLANATSETVNLKDPSKAGTVKLVRDSVEKLNIKNGGFVVEMFPYAVEYAFSMLACIASILLYVMFVLVNYNVIDGDKLYFKPCFDPLDTKKFYDPFDDTTPTTTGSPSHQ